MIRRAGLVVGLAVLAACAFAPSASAQMLVCPPMSLVTAPGVPLNVPNPVCTGTTGFPIAFTVLPGSAVGGSTVDGPAMTFTPAAGFIGGGSFRYTAFDGGITPSDPATVDVLVDSAPVCTAGTATTTAGRAVDVTDFKCTDAENHDFRLLIGDPMNGTTIIVGDRVIYTPKPGFVGTDSFLFSAEDEYGLEGADAVLTVTVTAAPAATPTPVPTPMPTPTPAPRDTTAPTVTLKAKKATYAKGIPLTLGVNEGAKAVLTISLDAKSAKKYKLSRSIGTLNSTLTAGNKAVTLKLSSKARKAFKKLRQMKVTVTAVVTDAAGNKTTKTLKVTLKQK